MFTVSIRHQTEPGQILGKDSIPLRTPQRVPAVLGAPETVPLITQGALEALNDQLETARRALLHQQGEFLVATLQYDTAATEKSCQYFGKK